MGIAQVSSKQLERVMNSWTKSFTKVPFSKLL